MSRVHPLFLPESLVRARQIDPANEFEWEHLAVATGPGGDRYVLSGLHYNYYRYDRSDERDGVVTHVLARFAPDGTPLGQAVLDSLPATTGRHFPLVSLCALPDGRVLVTTKGNRAFVADAALGSFVPAQVPPYPVESDDGVRRWAFRARLTPSGRLLCLLGENDVAISEAPVKDDELPALAPVTVLMPGRANVFSEPRLPVFYPQAVTGGGPRPTELGTLIGAASTGRTPPRPEWLVDAVPIDDSTYVVLAAGRKKRASERGGYFHFAVVDEGGSLLGHLDLDTYRDAAARGARYDVVADQRRGRVFHLNTFGLYVFDATGKRLAVLPTTAKEHKPLAQFQLREFDPDGSLVLVHEKQHLLLTIPVPRDLADLPAAVTRALAGFRKERARLKAAHAPLNWYWLEDGPVATF